MKFKNKNGKSSIKKGHHLRKKVTSFNLNEVIEEGNDDDVGSTADDKESESSSIAEESAEQKRVRIAKEYLRTMQHLDDSDSGDDLSEIETKTAARLKKNRLESLGKYYRSIADNLSTVLGLGNYSIQTMSGLNGPVTCVVLSNCGSICFSASKDNSVMKWELLTNKKTILRRPWSRKTDPVIQSSEGEVLALAISSDDRFLVSGGRDKIIRVFDGKVNYAQVHELKGHKDAVSSLCFQRGTYSLFSGSADRSLKHWDLAEMGYIETLFGHQDCVQALDCLDKSRPISSGADRSVRLWKVAEESHLVFRGHKAAADAVAQLSESVFASAGQDGTLHLWKEHQKVPVQSVPAAHGWQEEGPLQNPRWLSSLRAVPQSDLLASGSSDGMLRLWKASAEAGGSELRQVGQLPVPGFVNGIDMIVSPSKTTVAVATGSEHRLGRWWHIKGNRNKVVVFTLKQSMEEP
eukprot:gene24977-33477_t